jgi:hypothetical protein
MYGRRRASFFTSDYEETFMWVFFHIKTLTTVRLPEEGLALPMIAFLIPLRCL